MAEDARDRRDHQSGPDVPQYHGVPANALPLTASEDRQWATLAHFGGILGCVPALLIYLIFRERGPFTAQESKEALNFTLPPGGIVGVIGPNGAGKTTLFRMLVGQERPDEGALRLGNCPFGRLAEAHRDLVCHANLAFMEGLLQGHRRGGPRAVLEPRPGRCCVAGCFAPDTPRMLPLGNATLVDRRGEANERRDAPLAAD